MFVPAPGFCSLVLLSCWSCGPCPQAVVVAVLCRAVPCIPHFAGRRISAAPLFPLWVKRAELEMENSGRQSQRRRKEGKKKGRKAVTLSLIKWLIILLQENRITGYWFYISQVISVYFDIFLLHFVFDWLFAYLLGCSCAHLAWRSIHNKLLIDKPIRSLIFSPYRIF